MKFLANRFPTVFGAASLRFKEKSLEGSVKLSNGGFFADPDVTLQTLHVRLRAVRNRVCEFRLAASRGSFNENRSAHLRCEIDRGEHQFIDDVLRCDQSI